MPVVREQLKKKLIERLEEPHVPLAKISVAENLYKIKLRQSGYRLVYQVEDNIWVKSTFHINFVWLLGVVLTFV